MDNLKQIIRQCAICGEDININIDKKRHYDNGHYFGKITAHVGEGDWVKVGEDTDILGTPEKPIEVHEWTGKTEKVEYWECNGCYEADDE